MSFKDVFLFPERPRGGNFFFHRPDREDHLDKEGE
jgi:hypothetical protein